MGTTHWNLGPPPPPWVFLEISHPRIGFVNVTSARPKNVSENAEYDLLGPLIMAEHFSACKSQPAWWLVAERWFWSWQKPHGEAKRVTSAEANPHSIWAQRACSKHLQHHRHMVAPAAHTGHSSGKERPTTAVWGAGLPSWEQLQTSKVSELGIGLWVSPGLGQLCHPYPSPVSVLFFDTEPFVSGTGNRLGTGAAGVKLIQKRC